MLLFKVNKIINAFLENPEQTKKGKQSEWNSAIYSSDQEEYILQVLAVKVEVEHLSILSLWHCYKSESLTELQVGLRSLVIGVFNGTWVVICGLVHDVFESKLNEAPFVKEPNSFLLLI